MDPTLVRSTCSISTRAWLGGRASFVMTPCWRVELGALVQGLGVDDGAWGMGGITDRLLCCDELDHA